MARSQTMNSLNQQNEPFMSQRPNSRSQIFQDINHQLFQDNNSMNTRFKSMKDCSQKSNHELPFKSFLFEKCLFYFEDNNRKSLDFKKKVLEHSGSIVKNCANLKSSQLVNRDFFLVLDDGFQEQSVEVIFRQRSLFLLCRARTSSWSLIGGLTFVWPGSRL
jgi:hypothetical protein